MDKRRPIVDNSDTGNALIGGIELDLPLNRNLSRKLFGQLKTLLEKKT
jgi:hypothetical protein